MKILRILGIVVGVHAAAFMFVFAIPGCRTTTRRASSDHPNVEAKTTTVHFDGKTRTASSSRPPNATATGTQAGMASVPSSGSMDTSGSTIVFPGASGASRQNPQRPDDFGVTAQAPSAPLPMEEPAAQTYTVVRKDSLWTIAKKHNVTEKDLAAANKLQSGATLRIGQKLVIPRKAEPANSGVPAAAATLNYTVRAGDSLAAIARRAGTTAAELRRMNRLNSDVLNVGQSLTIPATSAGNGAISNTPAQAPAVETEDSVEPIVPSKSAPRTLKAGQVKHTVRPGESLGAIARRYGVPLRDIATLNHIANPASLRAGTELIIPVPAGRTASAPAQAASPSPVPTPTPLPAPTETPLIAPSDDTNPISPAPVDTPPVNRVDDSSGLISPGQ